MYVQVRIERQGVSTNVTFAVPETVELSVWSVGNLITKRSLQEGDRFEDFVNRNIKTEVRIRNAFIFLFLLRFGLMMLFEHCLSTECR
jgi:hypothetical protein